MPAIPLLAPYAGECDGQELRVEIVILTDCGSNIFHLAIFTKMFDHVNVLLGTFSVP